MHWRTPKTIEHHQKQTEEQKQQKNIKTQKTQKIPPNIAPTVSPLPISNEI